MFLRLLRTVFSQVSLLKVNSQNAVKMAIGRTNYLDKVMEDDNTNILRKMEVLYETCVFMCG